MSEPTRPSPSTFAIVDGAAYIGGRHIPWAMVRYSDDALAPTMVFGAVFHTRQILIRFECGIELSIVFGDGTYSHNGTAARGMYGERGPFLEACPSAEVAVFDHKGDWVVSEPYGWVTPGQVLDLIEHLAGPGPIDLPAAIKAIER